MKIRALIHQIFTIFSRLEIEGVKMMCFKLIYYMVFLIGYASNVLASSIFQPRSNGLTPLIVGGRAASQGQFPYQLALNFGGKLSCGATLISVNGVQIGLTSAQCTSGSIIQYTLVAGEYDLENKDGFEQTQDVMRIVNHPGYSNTASQHNDIAIVFIREPFTLSSNVKTISIPETGKMTDGNVTVSGWGRLWDNGPFPNLLHYVTIPVVNSSVCKTAWGEYGNEIIDGQLCAGEHTGEISPCNGDTGGPAVSDDGYLAGIVSWGWGCGHPQYPGVFTRVSEYVDWINGVVNFYKNM